MDQLKLMHKPLPPDNEIPRQYQKKVEERNVARIKDCKDAKNEGLITVDSNSAVSVRTRSKQQNRENKNGKKSNAM